MDFAFFVCIYMYMYLFCSELYALENVWILHSLYVYTCTCTYYGILCSERYAIENVREAWFSSLLEVPTYFPSILYIDRCAMLHRIHVHMLVLMFQLIM